MSLPIRITVFWLILFCAVSAGSAWAQNIDEKGVPKEAVAPFVIANTEFTLLHELVHVLIDEAGIPVLSREEDQADYLTAVILLSQQTGVTRKTSESVRPGAGQWPLENKPLTNSALIRMQNVIDAWRIEWTIIQQDKMEIPYSDPHALEIQRLYDMVCLTYGRDRKRLEDFRIANELPKDRAELCEEDFAKAERGLEFIKTTLRNNALQPLISGNLQPDFALKIKFEDATSPAHKLFRVWLEHASIIPQLVDSLNKDYFFPRPILVKFRVCGQPNAFWEPRNAEVNMCYELLDRFVHLARYHDKYAVQRRKNVLGKAKASSAFQ